MTEVDWIFERRLDALREFKAAYREWLADGAVVQPRYWPARKAA